MAGWIVGLMLFGITAAWGQDWPIAGKIAFASNRDGNYEIYVMDADGSNQTRLTNNTTLDDWPSWSPDRKKIAFTSLRNNQRDVYVMNADGTGEVNLTNNPAEDGAPAWSPDGTKITFTSTRDGQYDLWVMNADGSNPRKVDTPDHGYESDWSPDGTRIVYRNNSGAISVVDSGGSNWTHPISSVGNEGGPVWSPDGMKILYYHGVNEGGCVFAEQSRLGTGYPFDRLQCFRQSCPAQVERNREEA